ncbi:MAG: flagellar basal body-associated FliL family protein [Gallionella sp.]|nr:flagellar basal body-associated FliL family protein [Gallionella sp.]
MSKTSAAPESNNDYAYLKVAVAATLLLALLILASLWFSNSLPTSAILGVTSVPGDSSDQASRAEYVSLGDFTIRMQQGDDDQTLQATLAVKLTQPKLAEKVQGHMQEIQHQVNMVLQSKRAEEILTVQDKESLAEEIRGRVEQVMGYRKTSGRAGEAPSMKPNGIAAVLFTSFVIQR